MAGQSARHRLEQRIAHGVAMAIVDRFEAVEIDEQQRRLAFVALQISKRALEFALETAAVDYLEQRIDVGARLEIGDGGACLREFGLEPLDFGQK